MEDPTIEVEVPVAIVDVVVGDSKFVGVVLERLPDTGANVSAISHAVFQKHLRANYQRLTSTLAIWFLLATAAW